MSRKLSTRLIASSELPAPNQRSIALPIHQTTTFHMDAALNEAMARGDYRSEYLYTRMGNPTVRALEERLAEVHGGGTCVCTASGMAAISSFFLATTRHGDTILAADQLYGVTDTFLGRYMVDCGRRVVRMDLNDTAALARALDADPTIRVVWGETVSNPHIDVLDLPAIAAVTRPRGVALAIDNTFAGPVLCRPIELGADWVIESLSKCIAGHSDVHGGAVIGPADRADDIWHAMVYWGGCLDPHAAAMIWRGMKTLELRTRASCANAESIVAWLRSSPDVSHVYWPEASRVSGTLAHPGPMVAFVLTGGDARAQRFLERLGVIAAATSLGGVESLASLPFNTSHRSEEARARIGLRPGTVRLSVGCEAVGDLIEDLAQAIAGSR